MSPMSLIDYGIQTELSDVRTHVCPRVRRVYVYPTSCGVEAIETGAHRLVPGYQPGWDGATAEGYLVPPEEIEHCVEVMFRDAAWNALRFRQDERTSAKGDKAVRLVKAMLKHGMLPLPTESQIVTERDMQITGTDIFVRANQLRKRDVRVQVKCDFVGGRRELGGSGHLFLQIRECNPLGLY